MVTRLGKLWDTLRSSLWFVPSLMTISAVLASLATVALDHALESRIEAKLGIVYAGGAEGARAVLSTIAGSMITVAGVTFSITIVALSLASQQFGPRLLGSFLRDFGNQVVLGTFIATFVYCLLVLRTVRGPDSREFVPQISVTLGVALAVLGLGVLIYFIHHVAGSIQASSIIEKAGLELAHAVDRLFPERIGRGDAAPAEAVSDEVDAGAQPVHATATGYLQAVAGDDLLAIASRRDVVIRLASRPGDFVAEGVVVARVSPRDRCDDALARGVAAALILGAQRTPMQDVGFAIDQLVEIAVRALSPGVNDPFTAMSCLDRLGCGLARLAGRTIPAPHRRDDAGRVRVVARPFPFAEAVDRAFDQIREAGARNAAVTARLVDTLAAVAAATRRREDRAAVLRQAMLAEHESESHLGERGQAMVRERCAALAAAARAAEADDDGAPSGDDGPRSA